MYSTVFFPIFPWILQIAVIAIAIMIYLHLDSIGTPINQVLRLNQDPDCKCTGKASHYKVMCSTNSTFNMVTFERFHVHTEVVQLILTRWRKEFVSLFVISKEICTFNFCNNSGWCSV